MVALADSSGAAPSAPARERLVAWAMTTGEAGMRSQALGLAEAVAGTVVEKVVELRAPWSWLPDPTASAVTASSAANTCPKP